MPEWMRLPGDATNYEWQGGDFTLRLGEDINSATILGRYYEYKSRDLAVLHIWAGAGRLRAIADEIGKALAGVPKGVQDDKAV